MVGSKDESHVPGPHWYKDHSDMFNTLIGVGTTLVVALILGSYTYTWNVDNKQDTEKHEWRKDHGEGMDRKFSEIKDRHEKLVNTLAENNNKTQDLLQQILVEQKRSRR